VLQELHESELSSKRNQLEAVGASFAEEERKKEQSFLQEKVTLGGALLYMQLNLSLSLSIYLSL
jgi:hypothetical protein